LLVQDANGRNVIPKSIQLVAGRTGQEFNNRKKRKGAFGEDRYHATAIETGEHLLHCLVCVDLNMFRAGVVSHPEQWSQGGYNEIQHPRRKNILIDYQALSRLSGFDNFESFQSAHRHWVQSALSDDKAKKEDCWTQSIAIGSRSFVEAFRRQMRSSAIGRHVRKKAEGFELRDSQSPYKAFFNTEKIDIAGKNLWFWN
jgi:putative transposase